MIVSPQLSRTAVALGGKLVAWDVTHHASGKTWTVRVRVTPPDGTVYRIVRHGARVAIVPHMGLAPDQAFVAARHRP